MGRLFGTRLTPVQRLQKNINDDPSWPFIQEDEEFVLSVRFMRFYTACGLCVLSLIIIIVLATQDLSSSNYFLVPVGILLLSAFWVYFYREKRKYVLDTRNKTYSFWVGSRLMQTGKFHNVYIRLRKRTDSGRTFYYLVFSGYRIEKYALTDPCPEIDMVQLRQQGQRIAEHLGINYFDEANVSIFHKVLHFKHAAAEESIVDPAESGPAEVPLRERRRGSQVAEGAGSWASPPQPSPNGSDHSQ